MSRRFLLSAFLGAIAFAAVLPLLRHGLPQTHSSHFNLSWVFQVFLQLRGGQLFPRWLEFSHAALGAPTLVFYHPIGIWMAVLPLFLGVGLGGALIASAFLAAAVLATGLWLLARPLLPAPAACAALAVGTLSPYFLIDVYWRGALGEMWAIAAIPWVLALTRRVVAEPGASLALAALPLSYGFLILAHLPTVVLFTPLWLLYPWVAARRADAPRVAARCALALAIALGWTSFYWWPAWRDQRFVQVDRIQERPEWEPRNRWLASGLLAGEPRLARDGFDRVVLEPWWEAVATTVLVSGVWLLSRRRGGPAPEAPRADALARFVRWGLLATAIALFFTTDLSAPLYEAFQPLRRIQFPSRWMTVTTVLVPLLAASLLPSRAAGGPAGPRLVRIPLASGLLGLVAWHGSSVPARATWEPRPVAAPELAAPAPEDWDRVRLPFGRSWFPGGLPLIDACEWLPVGAPCGAQPDHPLVEWEAGGTEGLRVLDWSFGRRRFVAENPGAAPRRVLLRTFAYPGWRARLSERPVEAGLHASGRLSVPVPPGRHEAEVRYAGTAAERTGKLASLLTIAVAVLAAFALRRSPEEPP